MNYRIAQLVSACVAWICAAAIAAGQCPGRWIPGDGIPGVDGSVLAAAALPDGDIVLGGHFSTAGNVSVANIARFRPSTGEWSALGGGVPSAPENSFPIDALAALPNGDLIVSGWFTNAGGVPASNIARYSFASGEWSPLGSGAGGCDGPVFALAVLPTGEVLAGGYFTNVGGPAGGSDAVAAQSVAVYDPSSNTWTAPTTGITGTNSVVYSLAILPGDTEALVGGRFSAIGSLSVQNLAKLNLATGQWSNIGGVSGGVPGGVYSMAALPSGDMIVAGEFALAGGVSTRSIARFRPSNGSWAALGRGATGIGGSRGAVFAVVALPGDDVAVCGDFLTAGGGAAPHFARYSSSTSTWSAAGSGVDGVVSAATLRPTQSSPDVIIGGYFRSASGNGASSVARYGSIGDAWSALGRGTDSNVSTMALLPGGDVLVAGYFSIVRGVVAAHVASLMPSPRGGASPVWSPLGAGTDNAVVACAALHSGDVVVGGSFLHAGGIDAAHIATYRPSTGAWGTLGIGTDGVVDALAVLPDGHLVVAGAFSNAGGGPAGGIAIFDPQTGAWSLMGGGTDGTVNAVAILANGDVIAGGTFTQAGATAAQNVAQYHAGTGEWTALGAGMDGTVYAATTLPDGSVILGGQFITAGGVAAGHIARVDPVAGAWSSFGGGTNGAVRALATAIGADGQPVVIVGGAFTTADGAPASHIARLRPATSAWMGLGLGTAGTVYSLLMLPDGGVLAGGAFLVAGGDISAYFAQWTTRPPCPVDFNCSGGLEVQDIFDFLSAWFALDPRADFNGVNGINAQDIFDFLAAWFAGC